MLSGGLFYCQKYASGGPGSLGKLNTPLVFILVPLHQRVMPKAFTACGGFPARRRHPKTLTRCLPLLSPSLCFVAVLRGQCQKHC